MSATHSTSDDTVFALLRRADLRATRAQWAGLALLTVIAWLGATAFVGQYRRNQVAQLIETLLPGPRAFTLMLGAALAIAAFSFALRRTTFASAASIVAGFLAGHWLYEKLYPVVGLELAIPLTSFRDGMQFAAARLLWATCVLTVTLLVWYATFERRRGEPAKLALGWGDWSVAARDFSAKQPPQRYSRILLTGYLGFVVVLLLLTQAGVGFRPIRSGALLQFLPAIIVCAAANAIAEELIFRGIVQPAFIRVGGVAAGLWAQGALFGLVHWGASVGVLAALPMSLAIGLGSVVWGKAALETRGLGWVIVAHAMIDVAVMAAYFV